MDEENKGLTFPNMIFHSIGVPQKHIKMLTDAYNFTTHSTEFTMQLIHSEDDKSCTWIFVYIYNGAGMMIGKSNIVFFNVSHQM